ncbi:hypothetical protein GCM10010271_06090 [Streptomyces kurssanovii]|nr:hypothetical protein GCM10010271_06090 [Streptomyces kurssanovii]
MTLSGMARPGRMSPLRGVAAVPPLRGAWPPAEVRPGGEYAGLAACECVTSTGRAGPGPRGWVTGRGAAPYRQVVAPCGTAVRPWGARQLGPAEGSGAVAGQAPSPPFRRHKVFAQRTSPIIETMTAPPTTAAPAPTSVITSRTTPSDGSSPTVCSPGVR